MGQGERGSERARPPRRSAGGLARAAEERERLARLLRENLKKRKAQQRLRARRADEN